MKKFIIRFSLIFLLSLSTPLLSGTKEVVGWIEDVKIYPGNFIIQAKLDTGANISSLNAQHLFRFQKDGVHWARFYIKDKKGKTFYLERRVLHVVKVKRQGREPEERPVIKLGLCLGERYREVDVNLVDRSNFKYQVLVGRNFLAGYFIVDASVTNQRQPTCKQDDSEIIEF